MSLFRVLRNLALLWVTLLSLEVYLSAANESIHSADTVEAASKEPKQSSKRTNLGPADAEHDQTLSVTVFDENGVPVPSAKIVLFDREAQTVLTVESDYKGRCQFRNLGPGTYGLRGEKEGFYVVDLKEVAVGQTQAVELTLNHQQNFSQQVDVNYSPPAIDPAQTAATQSISSREIVHIPYPVTRDIRYALPLLPGVLQDATGQFHVDGSEERQAIDQLDGFNINAPASGDFTMRVNPDAIRAVDVQSSRYQAEYGKGSGGVLSLLTGMGSDRFHASGADLFPTFRTTKGLHVHSWTPRATLAGPLHKGKAWFMLAPDGEYHQNVFEGLPAGADRSIATRFNNLAKVQVNLTSSNILTGSFLFNDFRARHTGLSQFDLFETTVNFKDLASLFTVKDQAFLSNGMLVEIGAAVSRFRFNVRPLGDRTYMISPEGTSGNFFESTRARSGRVQWIANVTLPPVKAQGRHEFKVGTDIDRLTYGQSFIRNPFLILRQDKTVSRKVAFSENPRLSVNNTELGIYGQDRWSVSDRLLVEPGVRFDWDDIVHRMAVSPRFASNYLLTRDGLTKLSWGVGIYYDRTNLDLLSRPQGGHRFDWFYDRSGQALVRPPAETTFQSSDRGLKEPRFVNWSVGLERKLPGSIYSRADFIQKRGHDGLTFYNLCSGFANCFGGPFQLRDDRRDRSDSLKLSFRRAFKGDHIVFASYTHSSARSNAALSFTLEYPLFTPQAPGPLPWNSPNRFISWGFLPLRYGFDLSYSLDWRDGFPFLVVNQDQQVVERPGSRRYPTYFSTNLALEREVTILGYRFNLRAGLDDVTNRHNATSVNNNVDSPHFLTFGSGQQRVLTGHIRFLGRK